MTVHVLRTCVGAVRCAACAAADSDSEAAAATICMSRYEIPIHSTWMMAVMAPQVLDCGCGYVAMHVFQSNELMSNYI